MRDLTIAEAEAALRRRDFSARELTAAHLDAIAAENPHLNAFITVTPERALAQAEAADAVLARGEGGALTGIPLAIKDLFCTEGVRTTAASRILGNFVPPYESTVTAHLLRDGAVFLGKANLDEFAMGSSNMTSAFGPVRNPWTRADGADLVPGGSSGGSAAAVAARLAMGATATDTGGSIRQPAAFCGITGIKPTYGRCSRWGVVAFASSLDQAGPVARTVEDCAILLGSMAGYYDAYYLRAQKVRALILRDFTDAFAKVDALLTPTAPSAAFALGERMDDPVKMYLNDVFTVPASMAGIPGLSLPAGLDAQGLPLGLQVLGRPFDEEAVFAVAGALERAAGFTARPGARA